MDLLAQVTDADSLSGGAGWVGAGLLGVVMAWLLFKHLPQLMTDHREAMAKLADSHAKAVQIVADHCEEEMARLVEAVQKLQVKP